MQARMSNPAMINPEAMKALQALAASTGNTEFPKGLLDLVHLRASQINGCSVCVDMHPRLARKAGETDERLFAVSVWRDTPYFSDAERSVLALTEAVTRVADRADPVPDDVWNEATKHFDEKQLGDLVLAIANVNIWNRSTSPPGRFPACGKSDPYPRKTLQTASFNGAFCSGSYALPHWRFCSTALSEAAGNKRNNMQWQA